MHPISSRKKSFLLCFVLLAGTFFMHPGSMEGGSNYYLGVLADGYSPSLVAGELRSAHARVVGIKDGVVLFAITPKTRLTTFLKNLPFLKEVYVDAEGLNRSRTLRRAPLARKFHTLLKNRRSRDKVPPRAITRRRAPSGNTAVIDHLIREKAKRIRAKKNAVKK